MSREKYNEIITEAFKNYYSKSHEFLGNWPDTLDEFVFRIKNDSNFSKKWGLQIEERELTWEERCEIYVKKLDGIYSNEKDIFIKHCTEDIKLIKMNEQNTPTKLTTITYNDIKTEVYES